MATPYLTLVAFKGLSIMPGEFIDELETAQPGWILTQLGSWSSKIDARLRKRYPKIPFASPYPDAVCSWLAQIVTLQVAMRRGVDPNDAQFLEYKDQAATAQAEIKEAADGEVGLFDLPIAAGGDPQNSGIGLGGPRGYSEQSLYVWTDGQSCTGRDEDRNGTGSGG